MRPRGWRVRVFLAWMWGACLGTLAFAPAFGAFLGLVLAPLDGDSIIDGLVYGAAVGLLFFGWMVAVVAMVLSPPIALVMTRAHTEVNSSRYSRRVRAVVASTLATVSLPVVVALLSNGLNSLPASGAVALLPLFVFIAAMSFGHIPVAYTREIFDPETAHDPSVLRRIRRDRAETKFLAMRPRVVEMLGAGVSEREVAALITYEARMDFDVSQERVAALRLKRDLPADG